MPIYTPYTYLIGWSKLDVWYYGSRYARKSNCLYKSGCHPDEFWVTYFTSSEHVKKFREENGEPDIIEIRKTFPASSEKLNEEEISYLIDKVRNWEHTFLKRTKAPTNKNWLNKSDALAIRYDQHPMLGKKVSDKTKNKISQTLSGRKDTEETRKKKSEIGKSRTGEKNNMYGKTGEKSPNFGKKHTEKTKKEMSEKKKGKNHPNYGKKRPEHSRKISGKNHFNFGKSLRSETKDKISKTLLDKEPIKCLYCDFSHVIKAHVVRYHNENCKHKSK
jgi:hypothetical protein